MTKTPFVSVIVPARNEEENIADCVDSLLDLNYPKKKYEIIVSDGRSTDKTREIVKEYGKKVKLIDNPKINSAGGRNIGIEEAKGKIIAFTDADCMVKKNWLKSLVSELEPKTVVGGPNIPPEDSSYFAKAVGYALSTFFGSAGSAQGYLFKQKTEVKSLANANAMYWKKDLKGIGGYDEEFATGQDAEINYRLRKKGIKFYFIPDAVVFHKMRATPFKFAKRMFQYGQARAKFMHRHRTPLNPIYAFMPAFALFALFSPALIYFIPAFSLLWMFYFLTAFLFALTTFKIGYLPVIMLAYFIEHLFYGLGFLYGLE